MRIKTEELLYTLLWTCDMFARPTFQNITDSFESWAYRQGLLRQLQRLEQKEWLASQIGTEGERLHRLTEAGQLHAMGGRDPVACWKRHWDHRWRLLLFDVPERRHRERDRLRDYLHSRGFGCLQRSAWITPHPVTEESALLAGGPVEVGMLVLWEGRPCAGETDEALVAKAWDFESINGGYAVHHQVLEARPKEVLKTLVVATSFRHWLSQEREAWQEAIWRDPLLPECLLPPGYEGQRAWQHRLDVMAIAREQMRGFGWSK